MSTPDGNDPRDIQPAGAGGDADGVGDGGAVGMGDGAATSPAPRRFSRGTLVALIAAGAVVLLLVGGTLGLALSGRLGSSTAATPDNSSVDAGFARDMIVHHDQGVLMAHYAEQNTDDQEISVMAYDIGYTQTDQLGQMQGWLSLWDLPEFGDGTHMGWMGGSGGHDMGAGAMGSGATGSGAMGPGAVASGVMDSASIGPGPMTSGFMAPGAPGSDGAVMPGMATNAEISKLRSLKGRESDIYFLQLMIRHHQGGAPMMEYAAEHANNPVVRNFAGKMAQTQAAEVAVMTQMLAERGASPLPPPTG